MRIWLDKTVDEEFEDLGTAGHTGTLNDRQYTYLATSLRSQRSGERRLSRRGPREGRRRTELTAARLRLGEPLFHLPDALPPARGPMLQIGVAQIDNSRPDNVDRLLDALARVLGY